MTHVATALEGQWGGPFLHYALSYLGMERQESPRIKKQAGFIFSESARVLLGSCDVNFKIRQWVRGPRTHPQRIHFTMHQLCICPGSRLQRSATVMTTRSSRLELSVSAAEYNPGFIPPNMNYCSREQSSFGYSALDLNGSYRVLVCLKQRSNHGELV